MTPPGCFRRTAIQDLAAVEPLGEAIVILVGCKEEGLSFESAWRTVMRAFSPPQEEQAYGRYVAPAFEADRQLLRELRPHYQAAYEDREVTIAEFEAASDQTERRLDRLLVAA